jgi:hypothetical protein
VSRRGWVGQLHEAAIGASAGHALSAIEAMRVHRDQVGRELLPEEVAALLTEYHETCRWVSDRLAAIAVKHRRPSARKHAGGRRAAH